MSNITDVQANEQTFQGSSEHVEPTLSTTTSILPSPQNNKEEEQICESPKKKRNRLSKHKKNELAISATKLLKEGYSWEAIVTALSVTKDQFCSILYENNLSYPIDFNSVKVYHVKEMIKFFMNKFDSPLVEIRKNDDGFLVIERKNDIKGDVTYE